LAWGIDSGTEERRFFEADFAPELEPVFEADFEAELETGFETEPEREFEADRETLPVELEDERDGPEEEPEEEEADTRDERGRSPSGAIFVPLTTLPPSADLRVRAGVKSAWPFRTRNGRAADLLIWDGSSLC